MAKQEILYSQEQKTVEDPTKGLLNQEAQRHKEATSVMVVHPVWEESLVTLGRKGPILRSIHLGNVYPSNHVIAQLPNVRLVVYDRNDKRDINYQPWALQIDGQNHNIAQFKERQISPFFIFSPNSVFNELKSRLPGKGLTPAQLHFANLQILFPNAVTFSAYFLERRETVTQIMKVLADKMPQLTLDRQLTENGELIPRSHLPNDKLGSLFRGAECLARAVYEGKQTPSNFVINSNEVNVYLTTVLEAIDPKNQITVNGETWGYVFHASGPDMIMYIGKYEERLRRMHQLIIETLPNVGIPSKIFLGIIPSAELKLALPQTNQPLLDNFASTILDYKKTPKSEARRRLTKQIKELLQDPGIQSINFGKGHSPHASQYDALKNGPIYFPRDFQGFSFREIKEINGILQQLQHNA